MDPSFEKMLLEYGVGKVVVQVLQNQSIHSVRVRGLEEVGCKTGSAFEKLFAAPERVRTHSNPFPQRSL